MNNNDYPPMMCGVCQHALDVVIDDNGAHYHQTFKGQLDLKRHQGRTPNGVAVRVLHASSRSPPPYGTTTALVSRPCAHSPPTTTEPIGIDHLVEPVDHSRRIMNRPCALVEILLVLDCFVTHVRQLHQRGAEKSSAAQARSVESEAEHFRAQFIAVPDTITNSFDM